MQKNKEKQQMFTLIEGWKESGQSQMVSPDLSRLA